MNYHFYNFPESPIYTTARRVDFHLGGPGLYDVYEHEVLQDEGFLLASRIYGNDREHAIERAGKKYRQAELRKSQKPLLERAKAVWQRK